MLARYMLPVVPLVILVAISTMRRRLRRWTWYVGIAAAAFVVQLFVPPPYRIAPEDTLLYRDYVLLHKQAADELSKHPDRVVLTAWPASDELTRPYLGYVKQPLPVVRIENFSAPEIERAAQAVDQFNVAYLFCTKWEPPHPFFGGFPLESSSRSGSSTITRTCRRKKRRAFWEEEWSIIRIVTMNGLDWWRLRRRRMRG